jgi:predicted TPR repeat methyltransferase
MTVPDKDISDIQAFYNDIAEEFAADWYANDSLLPVLKRFIALLPPSPRVLDLGCGAGYESMRLKRLGAEVTGVDFSEKPIQIAREKNPDIRFEIMDFRKLSPDLGPFDGIAAIASLIHIPGGELALVFSRMSAVLNAGGYMLIIVAEGQGLSRERSFIEKGGKRYNRAFYLHHRASLTAAAQPAGLAFYCEFDLPETLSGYGWKCFVYKKAD